MCTYNKLFASAFMLMFRITTICPTIDMLLQDTIPTTLPYSTVSTFHTMHCIIPYSRKFSRRLIFAIFANQAQSAKILPSKIIILGHVLNHYHVVVNKCRKMALYKYLASSKPPNPNGSLSKQFPSSTIAFANF